MDVRRSTRTQGPLQDRVEALERTHMNQIVLRSRNIVNANNTNVHPINRIHTGTVSISDRRHSVTPLFSSYITPSPSPDELVIQQRGRKSLPLVWSPDIDKNKIMRSSARKTPTTPLSRTSTPNTQTPADGDTTLGTSTLLGPLLRRTPRKRLLLDDSLDSGVSSGTPGPRSSCSRVESIRRTRAQIKKSRARASMNRSLSTCSIASCSSVTSSELNVSTTSINGTCIGRPTNTDSFVPNTPSTSRPSSSLHDSTITIDPARHFPLPSDSDLTRTFPSPPESETSEPEGGTLSQSELKHQLCSLSKVQLRDLLRDVLECNPALMEEIVTEGGGTK